MNTTDVQFDEKIADEMISTIESDFGSEDAINRVEVSRDRRVFSIVAHVSSFDRATRRKLYAKQKDLYRAFPMYSFDLLLTPDAEPAATSHQS